MNLNRTDRIIITLAILVLLISGALFYFDDWMWGGRRSRGESAGLVLTRMGDVRVKFDGDFKWQKVSRGQDLVYNDSIYAGNESQADLKFGESELSVTENTLVILRRQKDTNFLNLSYGTLLAKISKDGKLFIDTGDGKAIELSAKANTQLVLKKAGDSIQLDVTAGQAEVRVGGQVTRVRPMEPVSLETTAGVTSVVRKEKTVEFRALKPRKDQVIYGEDETKIEFAWAYDDNRAVSVNDQYTLEFSDQPTFEQVQLSKKVTGRMSTDLLLKTSLSLFYRVRSPSGEMSQVERVRFVRLSGVEIVRPRQGDVWLAPAGETTEVPLVFSKESQAGVRYEIATDAEFNDVVASQVTFDNNVKAELAVGAYFIRARSDYGEGRLTRWSESLAFRVDQALQELRLSDAGITNEVLIPNAEYPKAIYGSRGDKALSFLAENGFLQRFFPWTQEQFDELRIFLQGEDTVRVQKDIRWPNDKLAPGNYVYRYQVTKAGHQPSQWSAEKTLRIRMEPARPLGEAHLGEPLSSGEVEASWRFTPLLFAKKYDVEIADDPGFKNPRELRVSKNRVVVSLKPGRYFWRVRARDARGRIISDFSRAYELKEIPSAIPVMLAKDEPQTEEKIAREPSVTKNEKSSVNEIDSTSRAKADTPPTKPWQENGWWAWLGTGYNYVDYRQSVPGRLTINYQNVKGPSQYLEGGYFGKNGLGGVLTYKNTPGEVRLKNAPIDTGVYSWTTVSLEAQMRRIFPRKVLKRKLTYGMRLGVQQHKAPFIFIDAYGDAKLKVNEMNTASLGLFAELARKRWKYYGLLRYQSPFSSKSSGATEYRINPVVAFDGSLGTSYNFTPQVKLGFFFYGQMHQYNFIFSDGEQINNGFQSLFYSNMDLRLGIDF